MCSHLETAWENSGGRGLSLILCLGLKSWKVLEAKGMKTERLVVRLSFPLSVAKVE